MFENVKNFLGFIIAMLFVLVLGALTISPNKKMVLHEDPILFFGMIIVTLSVIVGSFYFRKENENHV
jgi:Na+-translocating ferredoxin:NAD+ oxidoreductase RnfE subunit